jgi:hypothetical protein
VRRYAIAIATEGAAGPGDHFPDKVTNLVRCLTSPDQSPGTQETQRGPIIEPETLKTNTHQPPPCFSRTETPIATAPRALGAFVPATFGLVL